MIDLREVKASAVIGFLFGFVCIVVLIIFAWWLMWDADTTNHLKIVNENLQRYESAWNKAGAQVKIGYADIITHGFPMEKKIRLLRPYVRIQTSGGVMQISANYLSFYPVDDDVNLYKIELLPNMSVSFRTSAKTQEDYILHVRNLPTLYVKSEGKESIQRKLVTEFGVTYKDSLVLDIQKGSLTQKVPFRVTATEEPKWSYIPGKITPLAEALRGLLKRAIP